MKKIKCLCCKEKFYPKKGYIVSRNIEGAFTLLKTLEYMDAMDCPTCGAMVILKKNGRWKRD